MGDVELQRLDGAQTRAHFEEIQVVYAAAFPGNDLGDHEHRTMGQAASAGFETVTASTQGTLVGFVYGLPLSLHSAWWKGLKPSRSDDFTAETGRRTFAVIDLAVLPSHRGQGLGRRLMDELLGSRSEERATLATNPDERGVQQMYERWGWSRVGRVPGTAGETNPAFDLYVMALRSVPDSSSSSR
ncbi:GNAT family N-acetyltransferase [Actinomadura alba]|uniref:GNAT family N-acetyltransferase n=1 Tax=Actinomadura alba TaxID=406431 RepID=A0ABR7M1C1_9ACTN|nr:GNAT family N-acetyltransferase [Actinomadura alba]MBC6470911.1 GNAT family N-acetyltransferase [Actinomadura alba]